VSLRAPALSILKSIAETNNTSFTAAAMNILVRVFLLFCLLMVYWYLDDFLGVTGRIRAIVFGHARQEDQGEQGRDSPNS
jgi:hypothetical protein